MKEAGIEISVRQSFLSDPAVAVKNLKVPYSLILLIYIRQQDTVSQALFGIVVPASFIT